MSKAHTIALIGALFASHLLLTRAAIAESPSALISDAPRSPLLSRGETGVKSEELARQAEIYSSRGLDVPSGYTVDRSLLAYAYALSAEFPRSLGSLDATDRWLDIGAGEGRAVLDYCAGRYEALYAPRERRARKARAVAMSIEDRRTQRWHQAAAGLEAGQISYLSGKRLSQYSAQELGRFRMITDVLGGFSYTDSLSRFTEKTLALLEEDGVFYTVLQDVQSEHGKNRPYYAGSPFLTELTEADGSELRVCSWLKKIGCVQVSCELRTDRTPPIEVYRIQKVCKDVSVPALSPLHYEAGTPPERRFVMTQPAARPTAAR